MTALRILDIASDTDLGRIPPCADPRFDHRTCDYWEDADRGSRAARPAWLKAPAVEPRPAPPATTDNPFAPAPRADDWNPFAQASATRDPFGDDDPFTTPEVNPFASRAPVERPRTTGIPRKLALLDRGRTVFGSYAKVLLVGEEPVAWAQFGPLSAYPRAMRIRELYPRLPDTPLPAVITCIATTASARSQGHAAHLVAAVCDDLADRGFAAIEAYPDLTQSPDETSAARPAFWERCGFVLAVTDERFPVMRRELA